MKRFFFAVIIFFNAFNVFGQNNKIPDEVINSFKAAGIQAASEGNAAIDFTSFLLDGKKIALSQFKGRVVFLNFWTADCVSCRSEMISLEAVYKKFKNKRFEILAVNLGDSKNKISSFMNEHKFSFPVVLDEEKTSGSYYHVRSTPTTYIIDKRGMIIARVVGSINWNTPAIISAIETALQN